jgi:hypothetical protein
MIDRGRRVVPDLAVAGRDDFVQEVFENEGGTWSGVEPGSPGSAALWLVERCLAPVTPEAVRVLEATAAICRTTRLELGSRAGREFEDRFSAHVQELASTLGRPQPDLLAIDLGRSSSGRPAPSATWWPVEGGRVRLQTERPADDPLGWVDEWESVLSMLVADSAAGRYAAETLASLAKAERKGMPDVRRQAREAALEHLRTVAPDLAERVSTWAMDGHYG